MEPEYVEPTAASRRKAIALVVFAVVAAAVLQFLLAPRYFAFVNSLPICERLPWLRSLLFGLLGSIPLFGLWGVWLAWRVFKHGQWPLPNAWVWRRTRIHRGMGAKAHACMLLGGSCLAISLPFLAWQWLGRTGLLSQPAQCAPNLSIERTSSSVLRTLPVAAHVQR